MMEQATVEKTLKVTKQYTYKEVLEASMRYFKDDELAATTWIKKYAMQDSDGNYVELTPDDMHKRMAAEFSRVETNYQKGLKLNGNAKNLSAYGQVRTALTEGTIYELFKDFQYVVPQGSVMATLGNPYVIASLSNCVVLPKIQDSYGGILYTDQQLVQLFKRRCGVGIDMTTLRPSGSNVSNAAGTTSGPISFMERFSNTTREVAQNGRRGALMITMDVAHPNIEEFVTVKQDLTKVTGANISVRLSDEFMTAVEKDTEFMLRWPVDSDTPQVQKLIQARELWDTIISCAHKTAEPGLIFWDRQHYYSTSSVYPEYENVSTNPCSEIAMQGGDSCRLIALNLFNFVDNPFTKEASFDFDKFYKITYESQRLMDNLVDLELEAIDKILNKFDSDPEPDNIKIIERETWELLYKNGKSGRRTGLGFTALADTLAALGLKYDSDESIALTEEMMKRKCEAEFDSSIDMAIERGSFNAFDPEIEKTSEFVQMLEEEIPSVYERMMIHGRRNISISTAAPTGSLSMLTQTSSGIEPVFLLSYKRRRKVNVADKNVKISFVDKMGDAWEEFDVYHQKLNNWSEITGKNPTDRSPYHGSTAPEIKWIKRVEMQSVIQKYITHSISSTINLPATVTTDKIGEIYMESWKHGLKGVTVYRDGSRSGILVTNETEKEPKEFVETSAPRRPKKLFARIVRFQNDYEKWIGVVGILNSRPYEIFTGKAEDSFFLPNWVETGWVIKNKDIRNKSRYDFQYIDKEGYRVTIEGLSRSFNKEYWNYAKLISGVLRHGMPLKYVVDLISDLNLHEEVINTWKNGVARALKQFIPNGTEATDKECPACEDEEGLVYQEGCLRCKSCGHTKC